jgi:hypothetical protein
MGQLWILHPDCGKLKTHGLSRQSLDEDLHTSTETEDEMESRFLLNVVITQSTSVLELLSGEDESLLIWGNPLFVLNLGLDVIDSVGRLDFESDLSGCRRLIPARSKTLEE